VKNYEEREASRILDMLKDGHDVPASTVLWCLFVLGDIDSLRDY